MAANTMCKQSIIIYFTIFIHISQAINLGLIAGDLKPLSNPLSVRKYSRHSPIFINIHSNPLPTLPPITLPKLPSKPPPFKFPKTSSIKLPKLKSLSSKFPKLKAPLLPPIPRPLPLIVPPFLPPIIPPPLPLLPLIPPVLPLLPPILPRIPPLPLVNPLGPLRVPILGKTPLQKALGSEIKPVILPPPNKAENIMDKLLDLKRNGFISTAEYIRFKRLLL